MLTQNGGAENAKNSLTCPIKLKIWSSTFLSPLKTVRLKQIRPTTWWRCLRSSKTAFQTFQYKSKCIHFARSWEYFLSSVWKFAPNWHLTFIINKLHVVKHQKWRCQKSNGSKLMILATEKMRNYRLCGKNTWNHRSQMTTGGARGASVFWWSPLNMKFFED